MYYYLFVCDGSMWEPVLNTQLYMYAFFTVLLEFAIFCELVENREIVIKY